MKKVLSLFLVAIFLLAFWTIPTDVYAAYEVKVGKTITLSRTSNVSNIYDVQWSVDSTSVSIESSGLSSCRIKGIRPDTNVRVLADIYYYIYSGTYKYAAQTNEAFIVNVISVDPTAISIKSSLSINAGSSYTLKPTLSPDGATSTISWSSSNSSVATVNSSGVVKGVGGGSATIKARTANGLSASCYVTVSVPELVLSSVVPASGSTDVSSKSTIKFNYNYPLEQGSKFSSISLKDTTTNKTVSCTASISSGVLIITPSKLSAGHSYKATVPDSAVKSIYGAVGGAQSTSFTVKPVEVVNISPTNGAINVSQKPVVTIEFTESVSKGTNWAGIKFVKISNSSSVSYSATISGSKVTITPVKNLEYLTEYKVIVPSGAIANSGGTNGREEYAVSFTVKPGPLKFTSSFPQNGSYDIGVNETFNITFNYPIYKGENFDTITLIDKETNKDIIIGTEISENSILIKLTTPLLYDNSYILSVPSSAVSNGVDSESSSLQISFTTVSQQDEILSPPVIINDGGIVSMTAGDGETIYYTVDGSNPMLSGTKYANAFMISLDNTLVRAVAVKNGAKSPESNKKIACDLNPIKTLESSVNISDMVSTDDGYVVVGTLSAEIFGTGIWSGVAGKGGTDAAIIKYDLNDNIVWKRNFGGKGGDSFKGVSVVEDGYVISGYCYETSLGNGDWPNYKNYGTYRDYSCVIKYDFDGNLLWKRLVSKENDDSFYEIAAMPDGSFVAVGYSKGLRATNLLGDATIVKCNSSGSSSWRRVFGGYNYDCFNDVVAVEDGFVAVGYVEGFGYYELSGLSGRGGIDAVIVKYDLAGNIVWKKNFGGSSSDAFKRIVATSDGGFVVVGESHSGSFGNGDWKGVSGKGSFDAIIVKYDSKGNVVWKKNFGGTSNDYFYSVEASENGYIAVGQSYYGSFGKGDWLEIPSNGSDRAIVVKYDLNGNLVQKYADDKAWRFSAIEAVDDEYIAAGGANIIRYKKSSVCLDYTAKKGKIVVSGQETVIEGNEFTVPLYFNPSATANSINIKLNYPSCITYSDNKTDYKNLVVRETVSGDTKALDISCDFTVDNKQIKQNITCILAELRFKLDDNCSEKQCMITINTGKTSFTNSQGNLVAFAEVEDYKFSVQPIPLKELFILGKTEINGKSRYRYSNFPSDAEVGDVVWSVSDQKIATIDQNGWLTPLKNGKITITATDSLGRISAEHTVTMSGIGTYINSITANTGVFEKAYSAQETERVLFVPKATTNVGLTASFDSGSITSSFGEFLSDTEKNISISALPQTVELLKKDANNDDITYRIIIKEDTRDLVVSSVSSNDAGVEVKTIVSTPTDGILYTALYSKDRLVSLDKETVSKSHSSVTAKLIGLGDTIKIMLFKKNNTLTPLCEATMFQINEVPGDLVVSSVSLTHNSTGVETTINIPADGILYTVLYSKGKLVSLSSEYVSRDQGCATTKLVGSGDTIKVMLLKKNNTLVPLCEATTYKLK